MCLFVVVSGLQGLFLSCFYLLTSYLHVANSNYIWLCKLGHGRDIGGLMVFTPQPLRAVRLLFSPMVSRWAGGCREKVCPACISETIRCRKLILGRDIG